MANLQFIKFEVGGNNPPGTGWVESCARSIASGISATVATTLQVLGGLKDFESQALSKCGAVATTLQVLGGLKVHAQFQLNKLKA